MRMYQPAWIELKNSKQNPKQIRIAAHPRLHPRIYKAIVKEKDMDVAYKLQMSDLSKRAILSKKSVGGELIIAMKFYADLSISVNDF